MLIPADFHFLQMVIIHDTVIYPFTCSAFTVNSFVFVTVPGNPGMEPEAESSFYINGPSITALGTFFQKPECLDAATFLRVAVFLASFRLSYPQLHFGGRLYTADARFYQGKCPLAGRGRKN